MAQYLGYGSEDHKSAYVHATPRTVPHASSHGGTHMRRPLALFLSLALSLSSTLGLAACNGSSPTATSTSTARHEVSTASYPFYINSQSIGIEIPLHFLDGTNDLPYIEANDWLTLLNGFVLGDEDLGVSFSLEKDNATVTYTRHNTNEAAVDNLAPMVLDFDADTITFPDYNLFVQRAGSSSILDATTMEVVNDEGQPAALLKVESEHNTRYGDELVLPLGEYGIDLVREGDQYLIPLQTLSDFIAAINGPSFFFNGQSLIMTSSTTTAADLYYAVPTGERSEALAEFGYDELCLMLDYQYGMKDSHNIESFAQFFHEVGFEELLKGPNAEQADKLIYRLIVDFLDDNHSAFNAFSYLAGQVDYEAEGLAHARIATHHKRQVEARATYYPDGVPGYEEVGNTAYVTFDTFHLNGPSTEQLYAVKDPAEFADTDTIGLIMKAHAMIHREGSPIENVVLDLSCNGGGHADAAFFAIAWFLGDASITMQDTMTDATCTTTYRCDANRDRAFDASDTVSDKNLFCLCSPSSFSSANLVTCMFKESGMVTLLGRTSGGGACIAENISSAWGTSFRISGPHRISFIKNGSLYDVDRGADPDFVLTTPEKYYDRQALTDYINSL